MAKRSPILVAACACIVILASGITWGLLLRDEPASEADALMAPVPEEEVNKLASGLPPDQVEWIREQFRHDPRAALSWQKLPIEPLADSSALVAAMRSAEWVIEDPTYRDEDRQASIAGAVELIHDLGTDDFEGLLRASSARGEVWDVKSLGPALQEIPAKRGESGLEAVWRLHEHLLSKNHGRPPWSGFSREKLRVIVTRTSSTEEGQAQADAISSFSQETPSTYGSVADSWAGQVPGGYKGYVRQHGEVRVMAVRVYIKNTAEASAVLPYMIQFWWDEERRVWHPMRLTTNWLLYSEYWYVF